MSLGVIMENLALGMILGGSPGSLYKEWEDLERDH